MAKRLAIVERLPGHSEVMGGFAAMALELGYDTHLLFNSRDRYHLMEYFQSRIPLPPEKIHDWNYVTDASANFDVIVLTTANVWLDYGYWLKQWSANQRLIVVHHNPEDLEMNPYGASLYLTPWAGLEKWIFPLYSKPRDRVEFDPEAASLSDVAGDVAGTELPTLITVGTFEGNDIAGAFAYMRAGGKLVHHDRHPCHHFPGEGQYTQHVGLDGTQFMTSLAQQKRPFFLWLPIVPESDYMVCRFTAALIPGIDMNCIMVMPEKLRARYGFPKHGVITYETSVTEAECLKGLCGSRSTQQERRKQSLAWASEQWNKNMAVFREVLGSGAGPTY